jgi:sulfhydrogenase subunit delta
LSIVYATPAFVSTLDTSTPMSDHVEVDFELRGCPIDRHQLLEVISAHLAGRRPNIPESSVCIECKQRQNPCVMVTDGMACLGPITQSGCGALCPTFHRGCYGCFGPAETTNTSAMIGALRAQGMPDDELERLFHTFNAWSEENRDAVMVAPPRRRER